jgi:acetyl-CoA carboxylase biotin carboxyl carrier protein
MDISQNDVHQILKIIDETEHLDEVELVVDGLRLHVRRSAQSGAAPASADRVEREQAPIERAKPAERAEGGQPPAKVAAPSTLKSEAEVPQGMIGIRAPMLGSFYRSPAPGEKPFVEVGQKVKANDTVCLIEVMKLFNSIKAGVDGEVMQIVADDGGLVEYDQVLILIKPNNTAV